MGSRALAARNANTDRTPPPELRGQKKSHSPWSAPRTKKRANVHVEPAPAPLAPIEEDFSSPPKRRNGGGSPAARELRLSKAGLAAQEARPLEEAGPLAQGLLLGSSVDGYSPLASGLVRASFTAGISAASFGAAPAAQQQDGGAAAAAGAAAAGDTQQGAATAAAAEPGHGAGHAHADRLLVTDGDASAPLELAECSYGTLSRSWTAPLAVVHGAAGGAHGSAAQDHPRPMSQLTDRSRRSHAEMELDLRSSWGSERSADVLPWREMQARLHEEYAAVHAARQQQGDACPAQPHEAMLRASSESLRDSLEMPSCTDRTASFVPLRTSIRGHWQQSHLPSSSPAGESRAQHKLPSSLQSPAFLRPHGSAQKHRGGACFLCPSPFCKPPRQAEEEAEVVRRTESEEFVLHRTRSFGNCAAATASRERPSGKLRRESLNRPPSPGELVHRQDGFSAKCSTPVHLLSPQSALSDEEGPGYSPEPGEGCCSSPDQPPTSQDLLACLRDQSTNPTIDELNDMLRCFCTLDVHPREAEELVTEACKSCEGLAPNDKTLRTLDKLWAAYEQTYG